MGKRVTRSPTPHDDYADRLKSGWESRRLAYRESEELLGLPVVCLFTSFRFWDGMIDDEAREVLERAIETIKPGKGLALILDSPGGYPLAADRIVRVCRSLSGKKGFVCLVPGAAKSAATMIAMGAREIHMGPTSELGPIDPQTIFHGTKGPMTIALAVIVDSYDELIGRLSPDGASSTGRRKGLYDDPIEQGRKDGTRYVAAGSPLALAIRDQLKRFDAHLVAQFRHDIELSRDLAVKYLSTGAMEGLEESEIERRIKRFLLPAIAKNHGTPIYAEVAEASGLKVKILEHGSIELKIIRSIRAALVDEMQQSRLAICVESASSSWAIPTAEGEEL